MRATRGIRRRGAYLLTAATLVLVALGGLAATADAWVYWGESAGNTIGRADQFGGEIDNQFVPGTNEPFGVAADGTHVYWSNRLGGSIGRADVSGANVNQSFISGASAPRAVAVDADHIYWTNESGTIGRADLDGSNIDESFITGAQSPDGLALDGSHIYWTNTLSGAIGRADLDGSNVDQSFIAGLSSPIGLAVSGGHIFWGNTATNFIGRADIDGTNVDAKFLETESEPFGVAADGQHLYWADLNDGLIGRSNLDGSSVQSNFVDNAGQPAAVAVDGAGPSIASPTISTVASADPFDAKAGLGDPIHDTVQLSGSNNPTGTITFKVYGPGDNGCTNALFTSTVPVSQGAATSDSYTPTAVGTYTWTATYSGDAGNNPASGGCGGDSLEESVVGGALPGMSQATQDAAVHLGDSTTDTATLVGNALGGAPTGQVGFLVCGPLALDATTCGDVTQIHDAGTAALTTGADDTSTATSPSFTPTAAGKWCFAALYNGSTNYVPNSIGDDVTGCVVADSRSVTQMTSTPASGTVELGSSTNDTATVTGDDTDGTPAGSVSFYVCGPLQSATGCSSTAAPVGGAARLSGSGATATVSSDSFAPTSTGTWCFFAVYGGDAQYSGSQDGSATECFTVVTAATTSSSTPRDATLQLGLATTDTVTVSGDANNGAPTGAVDFYVCGPLQSAAGCTDVSTRVGSGSVRVTKSSDTTATATSGSFTPTAAGTWCFFAVYGGDGSYTGSQDGAPTECFTVTKPDAASTSAPHDATVTLGGSTTDTVTVTGNATNGAPSGAVDFYVCGPLQSAAGCTDTTTRVGSGSVQVTKSSDTTAIATSGSFTPTAAGTWCFFAVYAGDNTYVGSQDGTSSECFTVGKAPSTSASLPQDASIALGGSTTDSVTVTGDVANGDPTGPVSFYICGPLQSAAGCEDATTQVGTGSVQLNRASDRTATATSVAYTPTAVGTWCFLAEYSGDASYSGSQDDSSAECFTVTKASATTTSTPHDSSLALGAGTTDAVTVTGNDVGRDPTGQVSFFVCGPLEGASGCADMANRVGGGAVDLIDAAATSATFTPDATGTWCFLAVYGGDGSYTASQDGSASECVTVTKATPTIASRPSASSVTVGTTVTDGAALTGNPTGGRPTGSVVFVVCGPLSAPAGCASGGAAVGDAVPARPQPAGAPSATATSEAFTPTAAGTWCFRAEYAGDGSYAAAADGGGGECFTVTPRTEPPPPPGGGQHPGAPTVTIPSPAQPTVTITAPQPGARYTLGRRVTARYQCADAAGIRSCDGSVGNGSQLDTSSAGRLTFTVTATSKDGQTISKTVHYSVALPSNHLAVTHLRAHRDGTVTLWVTVPRPGIVNVLVTDWINNLARDARGAHLLRPAPRRFVWARLHVAAKHAGTYKLTVPPNAHARLVLAHTRYRIRLRVWATFAPHGVHKRKLGFYGVPLTAP